MSNLTPTGLETVDYGIQGWSAIVTTNMQRLNTFLGRITIGRGSTIGGNVWITDDVAPGSKIMQRSR